MPKLSNGAAIAFQESALRILVRELLQETHGISGSVRENVRGIQNGILTAGVRPGSRFMILFFDPKFIMAPSGAAYPWNPGHDRRHSGSCALCAGTERVRNSG